MNIGLDFDDTYTRDPETWDKVIKAFRDAGHKVYVTTWRFDKDDLYGHEGYKVRQLLEGKVDGFFFTGRVAKQSYTFAQGMCIDVWVDDNPSSVIRSMQGF